MKRVDDRVCVVTGGSNGIGKATCLRSAEEGTTVAIGDIDDADGEGLRDQIVDQGGTAASWHLNVSDDDAVDQVFGEVAEKLGRIDVFANNAGIAGADKPIDELTSQGWNKAMDVNVNGVSFRTKAAITHMRGDGSIVDLSSIYGIVGAPYVNPCHASKGAVREMSKINALPYATEGSRVKSGDPGFIWTPIVRGLADASQEGCDAFRANLDDLHPVGHGGEPDDIAAGIAYLAFDDAKFVAGSELVIDGRYTAGERGARNVSDRARSDGP